MKFFLLLPLVLVSCLILHLQLNLYYVVSYTCFLYFFQKRVGQGLAERCHIISIFSLYNNAIKLHSKSTTKNTFLLTFLHLTSLKEKSFSLVEIGTKYYTYILKINPQYKIQHSRKKAKWQKSQNNFLSFLVFFSLYSYNFYFILLHKETFFSLFYISLIKNWKNAISFLFRNSHNTVNYFIFSIS